MDKDPDILQMIARAGSWLADHPYATWGGISAFAVSLWASLSDGKGWWSSLGTAILAIIITLSLLALMKLSGLHQEWMPLVGMAVGFIGADRIRTAINAAWDTHKGKFGGSSE